MQASRHTPSTGFNEGFSLRRLEGGLGAQVLGLEVAAVDDAAFPALYTAFPRAPAAAVPGPDPAARGPGRLRPPLRRGAGACDGPISRQRVPGALHALEPRRVRAAQR